MKALAIVFLAILGSLPASGRIEGRSDPRDILERTTQTCKTEPEVCYTLAADVLKIYRAMSIKEIQEKTNGYRLPAAPFALLHPQRTKYSVLLIHGLNDSAYYLKDIAKILYDRGMNVVSVLLPGHGLNVEDMQKVNHRQWMREMHWGLRLAAQLGENVLVGGFSTGGVLATTAVIESKYVKGLLLFAPAIEVQGPMNVGNRAAILTCLKYINQMTFTTELEENPIKYSTRSANSICQLDLLLWNLYSKIGMNMFFSRTHRVIKALADRIQVPTYIVMTTEDHRVPSDAILNLAENITTPKKVLVYTPDESKVKNFPGLELVVRPAVPHSNLVLKTNEFNKQVSPSYEPVERSLNEFLNENFN